MEVNDGGLEAESLRSCLERGLRQTASLKAGGQYRSWGLNSWDPEGIQDPGHLGPQAGSVNRSQRTALRITFRVPQRKRVMAPESLREQMLGARRLSLCVCRAQGLLNGVLSRANAGEQDS